MDQFWRGTRSSSALPRPPSSLARRRQALSRKGRSLVPLPRLLPKCAATACRTGVAKPGDISIYILVRSRAKPAPFSYSPEPFLATSGAGEEGKPLLFCKLFTNFPAKFSGRRMSIFNVLSNGLIKLFWGNN